MLGQSGASVPKFAVWEGGVALGFQLEERDGWACGSVREEDILDGGVSSQGPRAWDGSRRRGLHFWDVFRKEVRRHVGGSRVECARGRDPLLADK